MGAQNLAQRGVNEVGCGVIAADFFPTFTIDLDGQDIADGYAAAIDLTRVDV